MLIALQCYTFNIRYKCKSTIAFDVKGLLQLYWKVTRIAIHAHERTQS